jgi:hypothetical protein
MKIMNFFKTILVSAIVTICLSSMSVKPSLANNHQSQIINEHGEVLLEHDKYPDEVETDTTDIVESEDSEDEDVEDDHYDPGQHNPFPDEFNDEEADLHVK